jgi:hypothetical protein
MLPRVIRAHRTFVFLLAAGLALNVGAYAVFVYPLAARVADADNRAARASAALRDARREFEAARNVATSKERAEAELRTFYGEVLPGNLGAAHRVTYLNLAQLARQCNLHVTRRTAEEEHDRDSRLDHLKIALALEGQYDDVRRFIARLETAPEFVIIDDVTLDQAREGGATLLLTLQLSTYYRTTGNAS